LSKIHCLDLPELEGWLTTTQVAVRLQLSRQRIGQLIQIQSFPNAKRVGDVMLIPVSDLDLYLQNKGGVRKKKDKAEKNNAVRKLFSFFSKHRIF
jgi:hypothetical protein